MDASPTDDRALLSGWGRTAATRAIVRHPVTPEELAAGLDDPAVQGPPGRGVIARGLGRSYGDPAQNAGGVVLDATALAGVISFDEATGLLRARAGTSLDDLMRWFVPRGWFVPVTPGTRYVTVGGAIANDIHGKNHHLGGSWCNHVTALTLATPAEGTLTITPDEHPELFWATAGGVGLTGIILDATIRMKPIESSRLVVDTDRTQDLDHVMALMEAGDADYPYSVAWIDVMARGASMGRGILDRGRFATIDDLDRSARQQPLAYRGDVLASAPPVVPGGLVNAWTIRAFNELWYRKAPRRKHGYLATIPAFFHPLDGVGDWNRLYGPAGFLQWQCALPFGAEEVLRGIVGRLSLVGCPSAVNVLKRFGPGNPGPLSFPMPGWTLTIDVPTGHHGLVQLLDDLDADVVGAGGRLYLAKDSRMRPEHLATMYPRLDEWRAVCEKVDPDQLLQSDLGRRLQLR